MSTPLLCLEHDLRWDDNRPRPLEPYRYGPIICTDPTVLRDSYPNLHKSLELHAWQGCYIHPSLLRGRQPLLQLARNFAQHGDDTTASIIGSLTFSPDRLRKITQRVQRDLAAIQLGPNKEYIGKVIALIDKDPDFKSHLIETSKERDIKVCDPFGGGGVLCFAIAEYLNKITGGCYQITLIDISDTGFVETRPLIQRFYRHRYEQLASHITFVQGNGLTLADSSVKQCDLIVSTMALHEHVSDDIRQFLSHAHSSLAKGGKLIVVDATRYPKISKKAASLLPILGRIGMGALSMQYLFKGKPNRTFAHLVRSAVNESKWLSESGIRSYASGFLEEELTELATSAGLDQKSLLVRYDHTPPVGSIVLEYKG